MPLLLLIINEVPNSITVNQLPNSIIMQIHKHEAYVYIYLCVCFFLISAHTISIPMLGNHIKEFKNITQELILSHHVKKTSHPLVFYCLIILPVVNSDNVKSVEYLPKWSSE